ncbi:MAG TPA: tetratricopeptide repeat protein, partial [Herpetosiphonaceae bacterium]
RDWGARRLVDLTRPERLFELVVEGAGDGPAAPPRTLDAYPTNLPAQPSALVGREAQVEAVVALLRQSDLRLLTLTGPGGIGKTRLAVHAAARLLELFPDGVWFVDLAPLSAPAQVLPAIAQACGVKDSNPAELLERLEAALRGQAVLLVLDNAEHVLEAAGALADLLARLPSLQLLVTSRERLHLSVEYEFVVPPLGLAAPDAPADASEAVRLFLARAQASPADRALLLGQLDSIAAICQRLDGLPLAIELAAARSKLFPPAALLARLHNSLPLLTGGSRDMPARQQTLRAAVAWSYDLLNPTEQALLRRLAVFAGGWDLAALEAVCPDPPDAPAGLDVGACLAGLDSLIDKSLVHAAPGAGDAAGGAEPRFRLLQTIRDFALEQLAPSEAGQVPDGLRRRHAAYFAELAEHSAAALRTALQQQWLQRIEDEHDNLRAALHWSIEEEAGLAARLAGALWRFWWMRGHWTEGRMWIGTVLARRAELPDRLLAQLLLGDGVLAQAQGAIQRAAAALGESLALWERTPDRVGLALTLNALGNNQCMQGGFAAGLARFQASLAVWRSLGDESGVALALNNVGLAHVYRNEYAAAKACYEEVIPLQRRIGTRSLLALSLNNLGNILSDQGDYRRAREAYEESLTLRRALGDRGGTAIGLLGLANLARVCGLYGEAEELLAQSADQVRGLGDFHHLIIWTSSRGEIAFELGRFAEARSLFEETLALARRENDLHQQATMGIRLALTAIMEGAAERCDEALRQALPLLSEAGNQLNLVLLAETAARLALARGEPARAAVAWA